MSEGEGGRESWKPKAKRARSSWDGLVCFNLLVSDSFFGIHQAYRDGLEGAPESRECLSLDIFGYEAAASHRHEEVPLANGWIDGTGWIRTRTML